VLSNIFDLPIILTLGACPRGTSEQWWQALEQEPTMAPLIAERTRRLATKKRPASAGFDLHVGALRDAGFREVATIWQSGTDRVLMAVR